MAPRNDPVQQKVVQAKKSYVPVHKLEVFYTGGAVALFKDGKHVACPCGEEVKVVDVESGVVKHTLAGDTELVTAVAVSPDGVSVFSSSRSLQTKWWNLTTGECKRSWKAHEGPVSDMAVDASGGLLATGSSDRGVRVWDIEKGYCTHALKGHQGVITRVRFHPDPHRLLLFSGSEDAQVKVWDLNTRACVATLSQHFSAVTGLDFSPSGWTLLSAARDKVVHVWDLRTYALVTTVPVFEALEDVRVVPPESALHAVGGPPPPGTAGPPKIGKKAAEALTFVTVGELGVVRMWRSDSGACIYEQRKRAGAGSSAAHKEGKDPQEGGGGPHSLLSAKLLPAGAAMLCVTGDQRLLVYGPPGRAGGAGGDASVSASARGGAGKRGELRLERQLIGNNGEVTDLRFVGADEARLAVATSSEQVRVHEVATMGCVRALDGHSDIVLCLDAAVSPQGTPLLASAAKDHTVRVWNVETGRCLAVAAGHMAAVGAVAFSRKNAAFLVSGSSDRTLKVWNLPDSVRESAGAPREEAEEGEPEQLRSVAVVAAHDKDINALAVAPNDSLLCSASQDRTAKVWRLPELAPLHTLRGHKRGVWSVEFSPVDQCVLTASGDHTVRLWALADGACLKTLEGHTGSVLRASFLSRGTQLVSSGADGLVKLWTIRSGECVATFDHHEDKVWALAVSREGDRLATGGSDSVVNVWQDHTAAEAEEAAVQAEEEVLKGQDLDNAVASKDYVGALQLAFQLARPFKMLTVFQELLKEEDAEEKLGELAGGFEGEQLRTVLEYVREWNTNARYCHVAQRLLSALLTRFPPAQLLEVRGIQDLLEGLIPYTQRHVARIDRLLRSTFLLDYCLSAMAVLQPLEAEESPLEALMREKGVRLPKAAKKKKKRKSKRDTLRLLPPSNGAASGARAELATHELASLLAANARTSPAADGVNGNDDGDEGDEIDDDDDADALGDEPGESEAEADAQVEETSTPTPQKRRKAHRNGTLRAEENGGGRNGHDVDEDTEGGVEHEEPKDGKARAMPVQDEGLGEVSALLKKQTKKKRKKEAEEPNLEPEVLAAEDVGHSDVPGVESTISPGGGKKKDKRKGGLTPIVLDVGKDGGEDSKSKEARVRGLLHELELGIANSPKLKKTKKV